MEIETVLANAMMSGLVKSNFTSVADVKVSGDAASLMQFVELTIADHELSILIKNMHKEDNE